jgi:heme exporter protein C
MTSGWIPWLLGLSVILLVAGATWALVFVPEDYQQGNSVRIMYIHVPAAILAQSGYMMMAGAAAVYLIWRMKLADAAMQAIAPLGASITFLALVTGAIWGKPTWGTWWVWDARLTSTLVLFFLYVGIIALRSALEKQANAGRACAILALVGVVNLPIIKYSVEWWYTLHQPASFSLTEKPAMPAEMWMPLLFMVVAYYCFFFTAWLMRLRNEILIRERATEWVKQWVTSR